MCVFYVVWKRENKNAIFFFFFHLTAVRTGRNRYSNGWWQFLRRRSKNNRLLPREIKRFFCNSNRSTYLFPEFDLITYLFLPVLTSVGKTYIKAFFFLILPCCFLRFSFLSSLSFSSPFVFLSIATGQQYIARKFLYPFLSLLTLLILIRRPFFFFILHLFSFFKTFSNNPRSLPSPLFALKGFCFLESVGNSEVSLCALFDSKFPAVRDRKVWYFCIFLSTFFLSFFLRDWELRKKRLKVNLKYWAFRTIVSLRRLCLCHPEAEKLNFFLDSIIGSIDL